MKEKRRLWYWISYMIDTHDWGAWEEVTYLLKNKRDPRCYLGMHKTKWDVLWYYDPEPYCERCDAQDEEAYNYRIRYEIWASTHSMHPLAWPIILYWMIQIKLAERAQNKD